MNVPLLPGPLFFFLFAAGAAIVCYLVHRWSWLSGLIAAAACFMLGALALRLASGGPILLFDRLWVLDYPFILLGREWAFSGTNLAVLSFCLLACGAVFSLALPVSQGWSFYPFGMGVVAALIVAVTARQYIYSILFLWLASILSVFVLSGGRPGATTGAVRFLALTSLAVMPLLVMPSYLAPDAVPGSVYTAQVLMVLGFGLLLMLVPFHGQLIGIAAHTAPMVPAFMISTFQPIIFAILLSLGRATPELFENRLLFEICRWLGVVAVAIGGLVAPAQRRWGYMAGYALLVDWGVGLIAFGQGTEQGILWALQMLVWRTLAMLLVGTGLTALFRAMDNRDDIAGGSGLLQRHWPGVLALTGGLLSLGGLPLTPGAVGRWPLLVSLVASEPRVAWAVVLAGVGVSAGALTGLRACLGPVQVDADKGRMGELINGAFALLAISLVVWFWVRSAYWLPIVRRMVGDLSFLAM